MGKGKICLTKKPKADLKTRIKNIGEVGDIIWLIPDMNECKDSETIELFKEKVKYMIVDGYQPTWINNSDLITVKSCFTGTMHPSTTHYFPIEPHLQIEGIEELIKKRIDFNNSDDW